MGVPKRNAKRGQKIDMLKKSLCPRCRYKIEIDNSKEFYHCRFCGLIFITSTILDFENLKSSPQPENGEVIYTKDKDFISFLIPKLVFIGLIAIL